MNSKKLVIICMVKSLVVKSEEQRKNISVKWECGVELELESDKN